MCYEERRRKEAPKKVEPPRMRWFVVSVHASTNHTHDWVVAAPTPMQAIKKLNYQLRSRIKSMSPEDSTKEYLKNWLNALRRWRRKYTPRFGSVNHQAINIYELTEHLAYSVSYFGIIDNRAGYQNILPEVTPGTKAHK
jgi:hypothetical protein